MSSFGRNNGFVYEGSDKVKPEWVDPDDVQRWIADELFVGRTLNFPCGRSHIGDYRADIDPGNEPDEVANLLDHPHDFPGEFDTVYCDPPYTFYQKDKAWINSLWHTARERLILQTPLVTFHFPAAEKSWYVIDPEAGNSGRKPTLLQVFDRPDQTLDEYNE